MLKPTNELIKKFSSTHDFFNGSIDLIFLLLKMVNRWLVGKNF